jgi:hypothetical protein
LLCFNLRQSHRPRMAFIMKLEGPQETATDQSSVVLTPRLQSHSGESSVFDVLKRGDVDLG